MNWACLPGKWGVPGSHRRLRSSQRRLPLAMTPFIPSPSFRQGPPVPGGRFSAHLGWSETERHHVTQLADQDGHFKSQHCCRPLSQHLRSTRPAWLRYLRTRIVIPASKPSNPLCFRHSLLFYHESSLELRSQSRLLPPRPAEQNGSARRAQEPAFLRGAFP